MFLDAKNTIVITTTTKLLAQQPKMYFGLQNGRAASSFVLPNILLVDDFVLVSKYCSE